MNVSEERKYRVHVLATLKAVAWTSFPAVFAVMAWCRVGEGIAGWAQHGFLKGDPWGFVLSPLMWAAVVALVAVALYSTLIKYAWDAWDRSVKYAAPLEGKETSSAESGKPA